MNRIYIVGASGSGKSTLARNLSEKLAIPRQDLDNLFWTEGAKWEPVPTEEFQKKARQVVSKDRWIIEGAQKEARDIILARADTIIWVDPGLPRLLSQLFNRTFKELVQKSTFCNGKQQSLRKIFSTNSIFVWAARTYFQINSDLSPVFNRTSGVEKYKHLQLIRLSGRRSANSFVQNLKP